MKQSIETDINRINNIYISFAKYVLVLHMRAIASVIYQYYFKLVIIYMCISKNELKLLYLSF